MRASVLILGLVLAACGQSQGAVPSGGGQATVALPTHPAQPGYQMRSPPPAGDRTRAGRDGAAIFSNRCGYCHLTGGMGTNLLTKQRVAMGEPAAKGLLVNRDDLSAAYVKLVVRGGKNAMPAQTKVDITDAELNSVAAYIAKGKP